MILDTGVANAKATLAELNRQGKTVIMVTHEAHVAAYARQRMHMLDGRVDRIDGEAL